MWSGGVEKIIESLVHLAQKRANCFGNERTHKHINLVFVITNTKIVLGSLQYSYLGAVQVLREKKKKDEHRTSHMSKLVRLLFSVAVFPPAAPSPSGTNKIKHIEQNRTEQLKKLGNFITT